jgi:hypothetical protein
VIILTTSVLWHRTIYCTIYCNTSDWQYNILQYFNSAIQCIAILQISNTIYCIRAYYGTVQYIVQYIAILQIDNTIYCNILIQQYNVLQYFRSAIQYIAILQINKQYIAILWNNNTICCNTFNHTTYRIGKNILQCIVIQNIVAQPWSRLLCNVPFFDSKLV